MSLPHDTPGVSDGNLMIDRAGGTPSQTVGPFFSHALPWKGGEFAVAEGSPGGVWVRGRVYDGAGEPVPDALVETWQEGAGFARSPTDAEGRWAVHTVRPEVGFIHVLVFARGLLMHLVTRVYFTRDDPVLERLPEAERETLMAAPEGDGYRFDIRLQGEHETVFFSV